MTEVKKVQAIRQLDSMFGNMSLEGEGRRSPFVTSTIEHDPRCDVHGRCSTPYRSSLYLHSRESTPGYCRDAASPTNGGLIIRSVSVYVLSMLLRLHIDESDKNCYQTGEEIRVVSLDHRRGSLNIRRRSRAYCDGTDKALP